jgi:hypothetical protein
MYALPDHSDWLLNIALAMASTSPLSPCTPSLTQRLHHPTDRDWAYVRPARAQLLVIGALRAWLWRHLPPWLLPVAAVVESRRQKYEVNQSPCCPPASSARHHDSQPTPIYRTRKGR